MTAQKKVLFIVSFGISLVFWVLSLFFLKFSMLNIFRFFTGPRFLLFIPFILIAAIYIVVNEIDDANGYIISSLGFLSAFSLVILVKWVFRL